MGTQTAIAKTIIDAQADYILAVKGNQDYLYKNVINQFKVQTINDTSETLEKNRGRIETRTCQVITNLCFLEDIVPQWKNLKSLVKITARREINGKVTTEQRYYISSLIDTAENFNAYIRGHWGVENKLHWTLDMTFGEDYQRKRQKRAAQNFALIQKIALNLLKKDNSVKASVKSKRLLAAWDEEFLKNILGF